MKRILLSFLLAASLAISAEQPDNPDANEVKAGPNSYVWIVTACEGWPCASAALVAAEGSKDVIAVPTTNESYPWVILQRVVSGSVWVPPDAPYRIQMFDRAADALPHFESLEQSAPVMLTVPDGRTVVVALSPTRRRSVSR